MTDVRHGLASGVSAGSATAAALLVLAGAVAACGTPGAGGGDDGAETRWEAGDTAVLGSRRARPPAHVLVPGPDRPRTTGLDSVLLAWTLARADSLPRLRCLLVARHGEILVEQCRDGFAPDAYANVKSVSKSLISALVGIAIDEGHLDGVEQRVAPLLGEQPDTLDPRKARITVRHLLSMQAGLERTSGG
ncbi:MAG: serine hydrolase, partial [Gemmatimonadota bacterium]